MYIPLIDMVPSDPDTMMTAMYEAQKLTVKCGQTFTLLTADQQLYCVMVNVLWVHPELFPNFFPCLGGMHMLMSFVGCIGVLMANTGLEEVLKAAFGGAACMLTGKNFPQNVRALRMLCECYCGTSYKTQTHLMICCSSWREGQFKVGQPSFGLVVLSNQF